MLFLRNEYGGVRTSRRERRREKLDAPVMDNPYLAKGWYRESEPGLGELLNDKGIVYRGLMLNALFNNISTGARVGHTGGQTIFINAIDLDLAKLANMANSRIHIEGVIFPWHHPGDEDGNMVEFGSYAGSYLGGDQYPSHDASFSPWLSLLTYEISLLEGGLTLNSARRICNGITFHPTAALIFFARMRWLNGIPAYLTPVPAAWGTGRL